MPDIQLVYENGNDIIFSDIKENDVFGHFFWLVMKIFYVLKKQCVGSLQFELILEFDNLLNYAQSVSKALVQ